MLNNSDFQSQIDRLRSILNRALRHNSIENRLDFVALSVRDGTAEEIKEDIFMDRNPPSIPNLESP